MKNFEDHGVILSLKDGIANISGLNGVTSGEFVKDNNLNYGIALNLESSRVGVVMFTLTGLKVGSFLYRTYSLAKVCTGPYILSSVIDALGHVLNKGDYFVQGLRRINASVFFFWVGVTYASLEVKAPGILVRQSVYEPLYTGWKVVDGLIPLGQGQRELIIGDRQTGKTAIAFDSMLNQSKYDLIFNNY